MFMKWVLDQVVSIVALLITWPFMLAIAIAVKLDSPGPVFYHRQVVGVGGRPFGALKFRTMYTDADERLARDPTLRRQYEENYKLKDDPRVTRVGRFLRRMSLDELPQLFNVLRGQMSLVGPRMITLEERARYGKWRMNLSTVKPALPACGRSADAVTWVTRNVSCSICITSATTVSGLTCMCCGRPSQWFLKGTEHTEDERDDLGSRRRATPAPLD